MQQDEPLPLPGLPPLDLCPGTVALFWLCADATALPLDPFEATLSPEERARADRFVLRRDRARFVLARGILRHVLAACTGADPAALRIGIAPQGKPFLAEGPSFNLSHSDDLVALAVGPADMALGLDVEAIRPVADLHRLAVRVFTPSEAAAWAALPSAAQPAAFFRRWTAKEACVKATGEGLRRPLSTVPVDLSPAGPRIDGPGFDGWWLRELDLCAGYAAALVADRPLAGLQRHPLRLHPGDGSPATT